MMSCSWRTPLCAALLSLARSEPARSSDRDAEGERSQGTAECEVIFGDDASHEARRAFREAHLVLVREGPAYVDVVHSGGFSEPYEIAYRGLELVDTEIAEGDGQAVVEITDDIGLDCAPGRYVLGVDDAIGEEAQILAILDGALLLRHGENLRYLRAEGKPVPLFKVSWQSPFAVRRPWIGGKRAVTPRHSRAGRR